MGCRVLLLGLLVLLASGCSFLLPTSQATARSKWRSFIEAQESFDRVVPDATGTNEVAALGFAPAANPNVRSRGIAGVTAR